MNPRGTAHPTDDLPSFAIGSLDRADSRRVSRHVDSCASCQAALARYRAVADELLLMAPPVEPPAGLESRILSSLQAKVGAWSRLKAWLARPVALPVLVRVSGAVAMLVLAALAGLTIGLLRASRQAGPLAIPGHADVVSLAGTDAAPKAHAVLLMSANDRTAVLIVDSLEALPSNEQYQLWLIKDGKRTSGGVFSVDREGWALFRVHAPLPLGSYAALGVTVEPAGGSPGPTGAKVLGGTL